MGNILLLGGAGFIGSNLIKCLQPTAWHIFVAEPEGAPVNRLAGMSVTLERCSIKDTDTLERIITHHHIDVVVHLVSMLIPGSSYDAYKKELIEVVLPSIELMQICARHDVKFVFFSSGGTIYGNKTDMTPFMEGDAPRPISYYGWSKQIMENSIHFMHRTRGMRYLILRPSNPYGHGQSLYGQQGLVAVAIGRILKGEPIEVWGDGSAVRDYIYIEDLADIFRQLLDKDVTNTTLNIGSGRGYSVNEVLALLKTVSQTDVSICYKGSRPVDVSYIVLDLSELKKHINIVFTPFQEGIRRFYEESRNIML